MKKKKQRRENTRRNVCSQGGSAIAHIYTQTHIYTHIRHVVKIIGACIVHENTHTHTYNTRKLRYTSATNTIKTDTYIYIYIWLVGRHRAGQTREFRFRGTRRREEETVSVTRYNNTHIIIRSDDLVKTRKLGRRIFERLSCFLSGGLEREGGGG